MDFDGLAGMKCTNQNFDEYYDNIIEKLGGIDAVRHCCPITKKTAIEKLRTDRHLNNTPMSIWDWAAGWPGSDPKSQSKHDFQPGPSPLRTLLAKHGVTCYACSQGVCLLKRIAVHIAEE